MWKTNLFAEARSVSWLRSPDSRQSTSPLIRVLANLTQVPTLFRSGCCTCPQHTNVFNSSVCTCINYFPGLGKHLTAAINNKSELNVFSSGRDRNANWYFCTLYSFNILHASIIKKKKKKNHTLQYLINCFFLFINLLPIQLLKLGI